MLHSQCLWIWTCCGVVTDKETDVKIETLYFNELMVAARVLRNWQHHEHI
jgi:hypothetical protein